MGPEISSTLSIVDDIRSYFSLGVRRVVCCTAALCSMIYRLLVKTKRPIGFEVFAWVNVRVARH